MKYGRSEVKEERYDHMNTILDVMAI